LKPIPKRLLIHSVVLHASPESDGWGGGSATDETINYVRLEPSSAFAQTQDNEKVTLSAVLIYDARKSTPIAQDWTNSLGWKITGLGRTYTVVKADPLYDGKRLHHWEMGLL